MGKVLATPQNGGEICMVPASQQILALSLLVIKTTN